MAGLGRGLYRTLCFRQDILKFLLLPCTSSIVSHQKQVLSKIPTHLFSLERSQVFSTLPIMETKSEVKTEEDNLDLPSKDVCSSESITDPDHQKRDWPWRKAKKVAIMISFCGKDYLGMQRNPGFKTIEEELMKAFKASGLIPDEWFENAQKSFFQRASRTDKGVSATKMIISMKILLEEDPKTIVEKINLHLPPEIRVQAIRRVTKNFNSKTACDARTYLYMMPTFAFKPIFPVEIPLTNDSKENEPKEDVVAQQDSASEQTKSVENSHSNGSALTESSEDYTTTLDFRMSSGLRQRVNDVLKHFVGPHFFHNYTSGKLPLEPSSQRYIYYFECGEPFIRSNMEFVIIKVKGQSFMLHQIRKMVGTAIAVVRGHASVETIQKTWGVERIDIPRAPGLGLLLEEVHYDRYNKRFGSDGIHEKLSWEAEAQSVEDFKEKFIYPEMIEGEVKERSMFEWLKYLPIHTFTPRHFESEIAENSPLRQAKRRYDLERSPNGEDKKAKRDDDEEQVAENDDEC